MKNTLLVIPVYNEEGSIGAILESLERFDDLDVVVVDDSSTDSSAEIVLRFPEVTLLSLQLNLGAWGAIQTGIRFALKHGYSQVITMDGDGQHHIEEIAKLLQGKLIASSADVVIGTCTARSSRLRQWAWRYFRKIAGIIVEDITSGFRLYSDKAIVLLSRRSATFLDYQDVGILLLLQEQGLEIVEVEVLMSVRKSGRSHIFYSWFAVAYYMLFTTVLSIAKGQPFRVKRIGRQLQ